MQQGELPNRDIHPLAQAADLYPELDAVIHNADLEAAFDVCERVAVRWKRRYHGVGLTGLGAAVPGALLLGYQFTLAGPGGLGSVATAAGFLSGLLGLAASGFILLINPREKWLFARFQAEWLRCLKFRQFLALADTDPADLPQRVAGDTAREMKRFALRVAGGPTEMRGFNPDQTFAPPRQLSDPADPPWLPAARSAYDDLRTGIQLQHFEARMLDRDGEHRPLQSLGDVTFVTALLVTTLQLGWDGWNLLVAHGASGGASAAWLGFLSWSLFVVTATLQVYERGRIVAIDRGRYAHYHAAVADASRGLAEADRGRFIAIVVAVEQCCLRELRDFCRDAGRASF